MSEDYKLVALLPMKAHSERVKGKNFREFAGKPLFRWILDALLAVPEIEKIVINTDARQILKDNGLTDTDRILIRDRKPEICGDMVSMNKVIADDVSNVNSKLYLMTHTTNPLLTSLTITRSLLFYEKSKNDDGADSLFTVNKYQTRFYKTDGTPVNHDPNNLVRTQDLETWYEENSNLYIFTKKSFENTSARIGRKPVMFETPLKESVDIDDSKGWEVAEMLAQANPVVS